MATPTQLSLYNNALLMLGEGTLSSTSEDREPRRVLDTIWNDRAVDYCLRQGLWNFAVRTVEAEYDTSITPSFGFQYAFGKPTDWIKTVTVSYDEYFRQKLKGSQYRDEVGYWFADQGTIYIRYVSNDADYGGDFANWTPDFTKFVQAYLAKSIGPRIKGVSAERLRAAEAVYDKFEAQAKSADASDDGPSDPPPGTWAMARLGGRSRRDNGVRTRLIG